MPLTVKSEDTVALPVMVAPALVNSKVWTLVPPAFKQFKDIELDTPPIGEIANIWPD